MAKGDGRGGARPGAGRPRNADKYAEQIETVNDRIVEALPDIIKGLLFNAIDRADVRAQMYLLDRVMGRPVQQNINDVDLKAEADITLSLPQVQYNLTPGQLNDDLLPVQRGPE